MNLDDLTFINSVAKLKLNEKKTHEEILKIRDQKLRKLLKHAYNNSSFYRDLYLEKGIKFGDLDEIPIEELPATSKKMVMDKLGQIITVKGIDVNEVTSFAYENKDPHQLYKNKYQVVHSSGSTGSPGISVYNLKEMAVAFSCSSRMDLFKAGDENKIAYYAGTEGRFGGVSLVIHGTRGILKKMYNMCLMDMNESLEESINRLNAFQPNILIAYGTGLFILAKMQKEGRLRIKPRVIENGGEGISDSEQNFIKSVFNAPVVNMYAASECYHIGIGKEEYEGIYLMDDFNYIEIMEDHILVTNLYNYTQPTIRYRINDVLTLKNDRKRLLPFRLIDNLVGRQEMLMWFKNEKGELDYVHPVVFTSFCIRGIEKFHIVLTSESSFEFLAVLSEDSIEQEAFKEARADLDAILKKKRMKNVEYTIKRIDSPIVDKKTRKFRMIIKNY